jgi:hypothetical protein
MSGKKTSRALWGRTALTIGGAACAAFVLTEPAAAQTAELNSAAEPVIKQLQKEIRKRDTLIESLVRRVTVLEKEVNRRKPAQAASRSVATRAVANLSEMPPPPQTVAFSPQQTVQVQTSPAVALAPAAGFPPSLAAAAAPRQFEVSPETAERALERTLVATGNLLVPTGFAEIQPLFSYARREMLSQVLFNINRNELSPELEARFGLPWESQVEVALPWNFDEQQVTDSSFAPPQGVSDRWGNAVGDLTVDVAKTFVHESGWIPSLLGRIAWEIPTGPLTANEVPLTTSGANKLAFAVTALKRQDPLVFIATGGYTKAFEANNVNPGNQFNFTTGAFLATSPETSLRAVLTQNFVQDVTINGITVPGSNTVQPIMNFGASTILGRGILVDLQVGLGLTNAAPKYQVILSSTYRFGVTGQ